MSISMKIVKKQVKLRVDEALSFINFKKSRQESAVRKIIQARVYEAHALATNLHTIYAGAKGAEEVNLAPA